MADLQRSRFVIGAGEGTVSNALVTLKNTAQIQSPELTSLCQ